MASISKMRVSEFYAMSEGNVCEGNEACYYCHAPCNRTWLHKDPPPLPHIRSTQTAKKPESPWMCVACWLWRRKRATIYLYTGGLKDGRCLLDYSTLILPEKCLAIDLPVCKTTLYDTLLCPPLEFALSLLEEDSKNSKNLLQMQVLNTHKEIKADTELLFTLNNVEYSYTIHELEETLTLGDSGRMPGARVLYRLLGPLPRGQEKEEVKKIKAKRGRPTLEEAALKAIDPRDGKHNRVIKAETNPTDKPQSVTS